MLKENGPHFQDYIENRALKWNGIWSVVFFSALFGYTLLSLTVCCCERVCDFGLVRKKISTEFICLVWSVTSYLMLDTQYKILKVSSHFKKIVPCFMYPVFIELYSSSKQIFCPYFVFAFLACLFHQQNVPKMCIFERCFHFRCNCFVCFTLLLSPYIQIAFCLLIRK